MAKILKKIVVLGILGILTTGGANAFASTEKITVPSQEITSSDRSVTTRVGLVRYDVRVKEGGTSFTLLDSSGNVIDTFSSKNKMVGYGYITSGVEVKTVQTMLSILHNRYDTNTYTSQDGQFGVNTYNAIKEFQRLAGLSQDGIVGSQTWNAFTYYIN